MKMKNIRQLFMFSGCWLALNETVSFTDHSVRLDASFGPEYTTSVLHSMFNEHAYRLSPFSNL